MQYTKHAYTVKEVYSLHVQFDWETKGVKQALKDREMKKKVR